jgi:hypothetical protein
MTDAVEDVVSLTAAAASKAKVSRTFCATSSGNGIGFILG